jgi:hypothetical protein
VREELVLQMLSDEQEAELLQENLLQSSVTLAPHLAPDKITKRLGFISNFLHYIFYKKEYSNAKYETEEDKLRKEGAGMIKVWKQMIKNGTIASFAKLAKKKFRELADTCTKPFRKEK